MSSRNPKDLRQDCFEKWERFDAAMKKAGIPYILTCTARLVKEQIAYFAQGRQPLSEVNRLRKIVGLPPLTADQNKKKITWTLNSKHLVDLEDESIGNDKARAFDIAICKNGTPTWDVKADVNKNNKKDYMEAGVIGESVGLKWGGRFKSPDWVHFEV